MSHYIAFTIACFSCLLLISTTHQLQTFQTQVLLQLNKHLEYPKSLESWNYSADLCNIPSSSAVSLRCVHNAVTELQITGDKVVKVSRYDGYSILNQTLSEDFSIDSFITTMSRLSSLKVVSLVALGIWGPLPDKIHRLNSLEVLDLSSNFLYGHIPAKISTMVNLRCLTLDNNFFNGTLPDWFDLLPNLTALSLKRNQLDGPFSSSIGKIKNLTVLSLSHNKISGGLPDLSSLASLRVLDLRENDLDSELPAMPKTLVTVLLSQNSLSGEIPTQFGELGQLQHLDLSFNSLGGTPPAALFYLPNISYLNLENNQLSGSLPHNLRCSVNLGFVDVSSNKLTGELPFCLSSSSGKRVVKFSGNCLSVDPQHQHKESYCEVIDVKNKQSQAKGIAILVGLVGGLAIVLLVLVLASRVFCRRYCLQGSSEQRRLQKPVPENLPPTGLSSELLASARYISQAMKLGTQGVPAYRLFSLEELKEATGNFDQSTYMGYGSVGKLYKGRLENGTYIAIRCLALFKRSSIWNIKPRLDLLSKLRHPNLVCLLGHCIDGGQDDSSTNRVFLIYEYVPNGNLRARLSEYNPEKVLKWSERLAVLIGAAKAVHFLHSGVIPGFFNNRLKANNILLDEHHIAKLSDYGLSIIAEEIEKFEAKVEGIKSSIIGTNAWEMKKIEDDIYSFGFILLEALVGATVSEREEAILINEMASSFGSQDGCKRTIDPNVLTTCAQESLTTVISLTNKCLSPEPASRPSIEDVIWNLQYAAQVQATADGEQKSDSASQT